MNEVKLLLYEQSIGKIHNIFMEKEGFMTTNVGGRGDPGAPQLSVKRGSWIIIVGGRWDPGAPSALCQEGIQP